MQLSNNTNYYAILRHHCIKLSWKNIYIYICLWQIALEESVRYDSREKLSLIGIYYDIVWYLDRLHFVSIAVSQTTLLLEGYIIFVDNKFCLSTCSQIYIYIYIYLLSIFYFMETKLGSFTSKK